MSSRMLFDGSAVPAEKLVAPSREARQTSAGGAGDRGVVLDCADDVHGPSATRHVRRIRPPFSQYVFCAPHDSTRDSGARMPWAGLLTGGRRTGARAAAAASPTPCMAGFHNSSGAARVGGYHYAPA